MAFIGMAFGGWAQYKTDQRVAVKAGVAYWSVGKYGEAEFKWITE